MRRMKRVSSGAAAGLIAAVAMALGAGCGVEPIAEHICGNQVREADAQEDCDSPDWFQPKDNSRCIPAGQPNACRYSCAAKADGTGQSWSCPAGYHCSADSVCRAPGNGFGSARALPARSGAVHVADINGD